MALLLVLLIPFLGGGLAWAYSKKSIPGARWVSLFALALDFALVLTLWSSVRALEKNQWIELNSNWITHWGVRFHLGMDGLSLLLILLTLFLGIISVLASWRSIQYQVGFFHLNLLWILSGILGVFLALDLFLFYLFWEIMLIPMYFLIGIWGYDRRIYAAIKFFLFTQASSLLMLLAILIFYTLYSQATGNLSFDFLRWIGFPLDPSTEIWLMLGFFIAFAVKLPVFALHTWLPDAHSEAPTAGSILLAGVLLKTGGYGMIRFVLPLFPNAAQSMSTFFLVLAVAGVLYGALLAYPQQDLKRMIAYTSISHLGFVLLGIFAGTELALQGAIFQMICHGISTGALFFLSGSIQERLHTRQLTELGGLWALAPRMGTFAMIFAMGSLGLPGLGNFIGEFITLLGTFPTHPILASIATLGFVVSTLYSLQLVQAVFHGQASPQTRAAGFPDTSLRESLILGALTLGLIWMGIYPQPLLKMSANRFHEVRNVSR